MLVNDAQAHHLALQSSHLHKEDLGDWVVSETAQGRSWTGSSETAQGLGGQLWPFFIYLLYRQIQLDLHVVDLARSALLHVFFLNLMFHAPRVESVDRVNQVIRTTSTCTYARTQVHVHVRPYVDLLRTQLGTLVDQQLVLANLTVFSRSLITHKQSAKMAAVIDFPYSVNDGEYHDAERIYTLRYFLPLTVIFIWSSLFVAGDSFP